METRVRKDHALVYASVGVHADVEITLVVDRDGGEGATLRFGHDGPDVIMDFADVDSLERLAVVAADGVRQLRALSSGMQCDIPSHLRHLQSQLM